jgi:uncharacterized membrane protein SpoIIM required for sporulation
VAMFLFGVFSTLLTIFLGLILGIFVFAVRMDRRRYPHRTRRSKQ